VSSSVDGYKAAIRPWRTLFGNEPVADFGPVKLKAVRDAMVAHGYCRGTVNKLVSLLRSIVRWGVAEELVAPTTLEGLRSVAALGKGRTEAPEPVPVKPVPMAHVEAVLPHVSRPVAAMIRLQLLSGCRPGEIVGLRPVDIDMSSNVWTARLQEHKTSYRGRERTVYFGPRAQEIIRGFLAGRAVDAPLFSAREAVVELKARGAHCHRRPDQQPSEPATERVVRDQYDTNSYRRAIERACKAAGVPTWSPNRLRHNAATTLRREHGLDAAQVILGHSELETTQVYAERDEQRAREIVARIG
jgi:integrase